MNKWLIMIVFAFFIIPMATAEPSYIFKQRTNTDLKMSCFDTTNVFCTSGTTCQISVNYPNMSNMITNQSMTRISTTYFNYTFTSDKLVPLGVYDAVVICTDATTGFTKFTFEVNAAGEELTSERLYIYIVGLIFLVLLIFGTVFIIAQLPSKDATDESGSILWVSNLKHLREVLWIVVWGLGMSILFILSNISLGYLGSSMIGDLFFVLWRIMFYVTMIGVPVYICWIFYKIFKDKEIRRMIERGVDVKGQRGL